MLRKSSQKRSKPTTPSEAPSSHGTTPTAPTQQHQHEARGLETQDSRVAAAGPPAATSRIGQSHHTRGGSDRSWLPSSFSKKA